ncbi:MAG: TIGR02452 family protein [Clostridiales bacterium]|nr:TIGR02452 family protein [Clostridiales bacterium]
MAELKSQPELPEEEKLKQLAKKMKEAEYKGLSEEEIKEKERQKEEKRNINIRILNDTLNILEKGSYTKDGKEIRLKFSPEQMREIQVFLPEDIEKLRSSSDKARTSAENSEKQAQSIRRLFGCENIDALALAQKKYEDLKNKGEASPKILALNLASATTPGGHTRKGASAQEEDLCRRTSLLLSLESENAKKYYIYNNARKTRMGSDGVMITPYVEVIKDSSSKTLAEPFPVSVISCAAPMVRLGLEGMSQSEYEKMLSKRIEGVLLTAASGNYRHLILGAFGCGVYGNDAALVSELFYRTILNFSYEDKTTGCLFDSIDFAVLCRPDNDYNYRKFYAHFKNSFTFGSEA